MIDYLMIPVIIVLILTNTVFCWLFLMEKKKHKTYLKERSPSLECDEMLADLLSGTSIVKISRINAHDIFLRSPRARRD